MDTKKLLIDAIIAVLGHDESLSHWIERWQERAAIREFDGEMGRKDAEWAALLDVLAMI